MITLASKITIARILLIPIFMVFMLVPGVPYGNYIAAFIFVVASVTDSLDGHIARSRNQITIFGKFLDPLADKLLVTSALIILVEQGKVPSAIAFIIVAREFLVSGLRMVAVTEGKVIAASMLGKIKTVIQLVAIVAILLDNMPFSLIGVPAADILLYVALFLTLWSGIDYFVVNRHVLNFRTKEDETK